MSEFHDLSELALNDKGESWGNLGYWNSIATNSEQSYSSACRSLAQLLASKAGLNDQSSIMDAGFGCGDQLLLWLDEYNVKDLRGINYSTSQTALAKTKLAQSGYKAIAEQIKIGSANDATLWQQLSSINASSKSQINTVLALDCAYHFPEKIEFFSLASKHLSPGGKLGVTDFVLSSKKLSLSERLKLDSMLTLSRIPRINITTKESYLEQLNQKGFKNVELTDISEQVMPKFKTWLTNFKVEDSTFQNLPWNLRLKYNATAAFLDWAFKENIMNYVVINAKTPL